ncbi:MAG: hypothetical protein WA726_08950 [Acidimicrobiia bacterium]
MIETSRLRELPRSHGGTIAIDQGGNRLEVDLPERPPTPALLVNRVGEAVKATDGPLLSDFVNRDTLWEVHGFLLDEDSLDELPDQIVSAFTLIDILRAGPMPLHAVVPLPPEPEAS